MTNALVPLRSAAFAAFARVNLGGLCVFEIELLANLIHWSSTCRSLVPHIFVSGSYYFCLHPARLVLPRVTSTVLERPPPSAHSLHLRLTLTLVHS